MYHVQFLLQTVSLSGLNECHSQKSFYHTSMLIQMVGKPHNCTSFKGHFLENGLKPVVCHEVNQIFWKIVHDFSIGDISIGPGRAQTHILFYSIGDTIQTT